MKQYQKLWGMYSAPEKGLQILLNRTQAGPGRRVKLQQKQTSPNHVQALFWSSEGCFLNDVFNKDVKSIFNKDVNFSAFLIINIKSIFNKDVN